MWGGKSSEGWDMRTKRDMKREVWGLQWRVEWFPGLRSGLWPLMSIHPFGAYCGVRGLDFYGDGFHLLESALSVSSSLLLLHFSLPLCLHFIYLFFFCHFIGKFPSPVTYLSSPPLAWERERERVCAQVRPHQDHHNLLWYFPNAILFLLNNTYNISVGVDVLVCVLSSVLLCLSVGFSQRWQSSCNGESLAAFSFFFFFFF